MLAKTKQQRLSYLNQLVILPLTITVIALFSFKVKDRKEGEHKDTVYIADSIEPAQFRGGTTEWKRYLERNLNLSVVNDNKAPIGSYASVIVFTVNKDGSISNVVAETKGEYGTGEEALRLINKGPKWQPAKKDGAFVECKIKQTIIFTATSSYAYVEIKSIQQINA